MFLDVHNHVILIFIMTIILTFICALFITFIQLFRLLVLRLNFCHIFNRIVLEGFLIFVIYRFDLIEHDVFHNLHKFYRISHKAIFSQLKHLCMEES